MAYGSWLMACFFPRHRALCLLMKRAICHRLLAFGRKRGAKVVFFSTLFCFDSIFPNNFVGHE